MKRISRRNFLKAMGISATALTLAACGGSSSSTAAGTAGSSAASAAATGEPKAGGTLRLCYGNPIATPGYTPRATGNALLFYLNLAYENLLTYDNDGNMVPKLATEWDVNNDENSITWTLRENVKFADGEPFNAEAVKRNIEEYQANNRTETANIAECQIIDDTHIKMMMAEPNSSTLESVGFFVYYMSPKALENPSSLDAATCGTGPFQLSEFENNAYAIYTKNENYWKEGLPYLDQVEFKILGSGDTALMELQGGSIDLYSYLTDSQAAQLEGTFNITASPSDVVQALFLNNAEEPLNDVKVRQAICYALDKDMINEFVSGGKAALISSAMLPTLTENYVDLNDVYGTSANVEKAKELLTEAGYPDGIDLEITIPSNYEVHMQTGEVVAEQLKAAGINATINPVEWNTWLEDVYTGRKYQATISGIACDLTPGYMINRFQTDAKKNFINFSDEEYDKVWAEAQTTMDPEQKKEQYAKLQEILCDQAGSAFIQVPANITAISKRLAGYKFYPVYVQDMSTVYITE